MKNILKGIVLILVLLVLNSAARASIIYSDLNYDGGWSLPPRNGEVGNEITAAGTDRFVTSLSIEIYSQGQPFPNPSPIGISTPGFADFQAQIYANNGAAGAPGTLLWQSSIIHVNYSLGLTALNFTPDILVPDTFTWTLAYYNTSPTPPALPTTRTTPPAIGSNDLNWFRAPNSLWTQDPFPVAAQIVAVPEPGIGAPLLVGLATWQFRRKNTGCSIS